MNRDAMLDLLERRNAANTRDTWRALCRITPPIMPGTVFAYLRAVRAGKPITNEHDVASFCGAAGLVSIHGRHTEITQEGLGVL